MNFDRMGTIDSGCTRHVTAREDWFTVKHPSDGNITVGGKNQIPIRAVGEVALDVIDSKGVKKQLKLKNVLFAPDLKFNLFSIPAAVKDNFHFTFNRQACVINTSQRFTVKAKIAAHADLYQFKADPAKTSSVLVAAHGRPIA
jgi:hypothetical protein